MLTIQEVPKVIIVMGVAGCGKSTIGAALAKFLECTFLEGDDYHSTAARTKMTAGIPLEDGDRWPWLTNIAAEVNARSRKNTCIVLACSALKKVYRDFLVEKIKEPTAFVYLKITEKAALERISQRSDHFMPTTLTQSQFQILEPPGTSELAVTLDAVQSPESNVQLVLSAFLKKGN